MAEAPSRSPSTAPTSAARSYLMSRVKGRDTKPEMIVRRLLRQMGYRFRLQAKELPGRPDIVPRPRRKAIFVHGCFWHRHGCRKTTMPKSNVAFWEAKFNRNLERDRRALSDLKRLGWESLVVWECETYRGDALQDRLVDYLVTRSGDAKSTGRSLTMHAGHDAIDEMLAFDFAGAVTQPELVKPGRS